MSLSVRIEQQGGPEVLQLVDAPVGTPGAGQLRLRHGAIGLNFLDIYQRSGVYKVALPSGMGSEAAGVVTAVGPGVSGFAEGDRVAYASGPLGAYSEERLLPAANAVKLPPDTPAMASTSDSRLTGMPRVTTGVRRSSSSTP